MGRRDAGDLEQRVTLMVKIVLQNEKQFMELTGVSLVPPTEEVEAVDSRVELRGGLGEVLPQSSTDTADAAEARES